MKYDYNYHKNPEKGYPKTIWWKIVSGPPGERLSILQEYDLVFDEYDYKIRKMEVPNDKRD